MIDREFDESSGDESVLAVVATAFEGVHLTENPEDVMARGRVLRRRKRAVPGLAGAAVLAVSTGLAVSVHPTAGAGEGGNVTASGGAAAAPGHDGTVVNMDNVAFSVHTDAKTGAVTVTVRQLNDPDLLVSTLKKAGIDADLQVYPLVQIESGMFQARIPKCTLPTGVTEEQHSRFVTALHDGVGAVTVDALPAGYVLGIGYIEAQAGTKDAHLVAVGFELYSGNPGTCVLGSDTHSKAAR